MRHRTRWLFYLILSLGTGLIAATAATAQAADWTASRGDGMSGMTTMSTSGVEFSGRCNGRFNRNMFSSSFCPPEFDLVQFSLQVPPRDGGVAADRALGALIDDSHGRVFVVGAHSGSPADQAGLKPGDVIWSLQGATPRHRADIGAAIAASGPAGIALSVIRDRREVVELVVHPDAWPPAQARNPTLAGTIVASLEGAVPSYADGWGGWSCAQEDQRVLCASESYPRLRCHLLVEEPEALELQEVFQHQDAVVELNAEDLSFDIAWFDIRPEPDGSYTYLGVNTEFEFETPPSQKRLEEIASECDRQEPRRRASVVGQETDLSMHGVSASMLRLEWSWRGSHRGFSDLFTLTYKNSMAKRLLRFWRISALTCCRRAPLASAMRRSVRFGQRMPAAARSP